MKVQDAHQVVRAMPEAEDAKPLPFREQLQQNIKTLENQRDTLMAQLNGTIGALNATQQALGLYDKEQADAGEGKT